MCMCVTVKKSRQSGSLIASAIRQYSHRSGFHLINLLRTVMKMNGMTIVNVFYSSSVCRIVFACVTISHYRHHGHSGRNPRRAMLHAIAMAVSRFPPTSAKFHVLVFLISPILWLLLPFPSPQGVSSPLVSPLLLQFPCAYGPLVTVALPLASSSSLEQFVPFRFPGSVL